MTEVTQGATNGRAREEMTSKDAGKANGARQLNGAPRLEKRQSQSSGVGEDGATAKKESAKKRRKVNHACIYCRRSHMTCDLDRPCNRCIKRNIGHLCHDEPRENIKRTKSNADHNTQLDGLGALGGDGSPEPVMNHHDRPAGMAEVHAQNHVGTIVQPTPVSAAHGLATQHAALDFNDWATNSHTNSFHDMQSFHPSYLFNTSEVTNEFNLLNEFLTTSLLDDGTTFGNDDGQMLLNDPSMPNTMGNLTGAPMFQTNQQANNQMLPPSQLVLGNAISRPASGFPAEKGREAYYMTAADPGGNESAEERMNKLLKAKYDAGILRPFNYIKGYTTLDTFMKSHIHANSRQKILRQLDRFRPKFRERTQSLTDLELVLVEMWFERSLMETGEIFRGNKEMAELIKVPTESLRDGKIALHEILAESSLVHYWESFGQIAFEPSQKAILTSCFLKSPNEGSKETLRCCFSFTIKRDQHNIPTLIIGNFLPIKKK